MYDTILPKDNPKQRLRMLRGFQALGGGVIQSVVAVFLFLAGGFRLGTTGFIVLMICLWAVHVIPLAMIRCGANLRLVDPSMTREQVIWAVIALLVTDELTGLINRRHMMTVLNQQKALAERSGAGFSICFFDLDRFKRINDELGHRIGDIVLKRFADIAKGQLRLSDHFSRFGGEEFVLVAVDADLDDAALLADRIREAIAAFSFGDVAPSLTVTISGGVARFRSGESIEALLTRADKALYRAKNSGRNCIKHEIDR